MLDSSKRYRELQDQVKQYQKYGKPEAWLIENSLFVFILLVFSCFLIGAILDLSLYVLVVPIAYFFAALFSVVVLERKSRIYQLDTDDWLVYYSYFIVDNLDKSIGSKKDELKKECRKVAIKASHNLLTTIKSDWTVGNFKIAKSTFGHQISDFKSNLEYRLLPALEEANREDLFTVRAVFFNLAFRLNQTDPSVADLELLNETMSALPSRKNEIRKKQRGMMMKLKDFFFKYRVLRHIGVASAIFLVGVTVYLGGLHFDLVSKDAAFVASLTLVGILVAGYLDYLRKEKTS